MTTQFYNLMSFGAQVNRSISRLYKSKNKFETDDANGEQVCENVQQNSFTFARSRHSQLCDFTT